MDEGRIAQRLGAIEKNLITANDGRFQKPVVLPVTKTVGVEDILPLAKLGIYDIGENRVQEIREKAPQLGKDFRIHMIGRLQSNKVKYIIDSVYLIHSLDRLSLAKEIDIQAQKKGKVMPVLLQVNIAGEEQKGGIPPAQAEDFLAQVKDYSGLRVKGMMTMMPLSQTPQELRPYFKQMRQLFDTLKQRQIPHVQMDILSMGMSGDYVVAAQEGATLVRIGSAIFK